MDGVELVDVTKRFGDVTAVDGVSLSVRDGEFFTIVGPSGCGKSTTLRMIAGFEEPTEGRIEIDGENVTDQPPDERDVGLVFQSYALFPHMTAAENVGFGLRMQGVPESERRERVAEMLSLVDLPNVGSQSPDELSGGQQQRIALARALVIEPDVLLLDEPLSNLDKQLRESLQVELKRIQEETNVTTIHVTHNQEEAMTLADRMCVLDDGAIEQIDAPRAVYNRPETSFVSRFVGKSNVFAATTERTDGAYEITLDEEPSLRFRSSGGVAGDAHPETGLLVLRPERIRLERPTGASVSAAAETDASPRDDGSGRSGAVPDDGPGDRNEFPVTVLDRQFKGDKTRYELAVDGESDGSLRIVAHAEDGFETGEHLIASVGTDELIVVPDSRAEEP